MIDAINQACKAFFEKEMDAAGLRLIRFDGQAGIIRCLNNDKNRVITLVQSITQLSTTKVHAQTIGTSGTIHALLKKPVLRTLLHNPHKEPRKT